MKHIDVIIIGAGPGGITLGCLLKKDNIDVSLFDYGPIGGKVNIAPRIDNFPPYEKIMGPDLAFEFYLKAKEAKLPILPYRVNSIKKENDIFIVKTNDEEYSSKVVVIATGTNEKKLGLEKEDHFFGHGLSYCALCDGHFFKNEEVAVIGGGNSAIKEAIYLTAICKTVYVIHRRNEFRCEKIYLDELKEKSNVKFLTPYICLEFIGDSSITSLRLKNVENNKEKILKIKAVFPLIGQDPNTSFVDESLLDEYKNVITDSNKETKIKGLFAIGDVLARVEKQIYLAVDDANVAYKKIREYLK